MSAVVSGALGILLAAAVSFGLTPFAIGLARRTGFYDHPREYRKHARATPFLGGAAVLLAFLIATLILGDAGGHLLVPVVLSGAMWLIGTWDDRVPVPPIWRVLLTAGAAVALFADGLGWHTASSGPLDLALTVVWIVGLVNAFNLMDNLDGACSTVAAASSAGIGALAILKGDAALAGVSFALCGSCLGFLPWNLSGPARIFLGDGGSMPIGFLVAALAMAGARHSANGHAGILLGALLVGLPILDVALVSFSRSRRGVSLLTGGRDHLTHRILLVAQSPTVVARVLAGLQLALCGVALIGYELGTAGLAALAFVTFVAGLSAVVALDRTRWRPAEIAVGPAGRGDESRPLAAASLD